jgi:hypothetical protein
LKRKGRRSTVNTETGSERVILAERRVREHELICLELMARSAQAKGESPSTRGLWREVLACAYRALETARIVAAAVRREESLAGQ